MDDREYIMDRVDEQIKYYGDAGARHKWYYLSLKVVEITSAASIPVVLTIAELADDATYGPPVLRGLAAALGAAVAILSGIQGIYKFQECWMAYRATCEMLKREKYFYETHSGPYRDAKDGLCLLVQRVENQISGENVGWQQLMREKQAQDEKPDEHTTAG